MEFNIRKTSLTHKTRVILENLIAVFRQKHFKVLLTKILRIQVKSWFAFCAREIDCIQKLRNQTITEFRINKLALTIMQNIVISAGNGLRVEGVLRDRHHQRVNSRVGNAVVDEVVLHVTFLAGGTIRRIRLIFFCY